MTDSAEFLAATSGSITAPAGCGKTHLIASMLSNHRDSKPVLTLTHTNAGVAALRTKLRKQGVASNAYRIATIDGWSMKMAGTYPSRTGVNADLLRLENPRRDYPAIRRAVSSFLGEGHIGDLLRATYSRVIVDEYQDCSDQQHQIVLCLAEFLPTLVLGDPMQAIFTFQGRPVDWEGEVCRRFPPAGDLRTPWRWLNAGTGDFGYWLLEVRQQLERGGHVDLSNIPREATWVRLDGSSDDARRIAAAKTQAATPNGSVLIIGESTSPPSQRRLARNLPDATTVESVDLRDLVDFAKKFEFEAPDAWEQIIDFASSVITGIGAQEIKDRVRILLRGTSRTPASSEEKSVLSFIEEKSASRAIDLLLALEKQQGVRTHRPDILRGCVNSLRSCLKGTSFYEAVIAAREQNRLLGRVLPKRAVGSTLLLKGLEAEVAVVANVQGMNAQHLYVAMTRGSHRLIMCSHEQLLP